MSAAGNILIIGSSVEHCAAALHYAHLYHKEHNVQCIITGTENTTPITLPYTANKINLTSVFTPPETRNQKRKRLRRQNKK